MKEDLCLPAHRMQNSILQISCACICLRHWGALKDGLDILLKEEGVQIDKMYGHGGLFKTPVVGQRIMAAAIDTPVSVMETAGEGGAWGIALLAAYMAQKEEGESLADYLNERVFGGQEGVTENPVPADVEGFDQFLKTLQRRACN